MFKLRKFRTTVYATRMAPIGAKLCQNVFSRFPTFEFSTLFPNFFKWNFRSKKSARNNKSFVLEKLQIFECYWQILHEKSSHFLRISSHYVPWWWGSKKIFNFFLCFFCKNTTYTFVLEDNYMMVWSSDDMMTWWCNIMTSWKKRFRGAQGFANKQIRHAHMAVFNLLLSRAGALKKFSSHMPCRGLCVFFSKKVAETRCFNVFQDTIAFCIIL